jgi:hypothetical protein
MADPLAFGRKLTRHKRRGKEQRHDHRARIKAILTSSSTAMRISLDDNFFDLGVRFREDKDNWWTNRGGVCERYGPGMTCTALEDGCDVLEQKNHFYINHKNSKTIYLYPRRIDLYNWPMKNHSILTGGKDDEIFRLDKTVCWKPPGWTRAGGFFLPKMTLRRGAGGENRIASLKTGGYAW